MKAEPLDTPLYANGKKSFDKSIVITKTTSANKKYIEMTYWIFFTIISSAASASAIGFIFFILRSTIISFIEKKIDSKNQIKLAGYNAKIDSIAAKQKTLEDSHNRDQEFIRRNLETFRNRHADAFSKLQVEAVQAVWDSVVASYKIRLHVMMLRTLKIDEVLARSKDPKIQEFTKMIAPPNLIEEYVKLTNDNNPNKYRPFVPETIWKYYSAYNSLMSTTIAVLKAIEHGVGDEKFFQPEKSAEAIIQALPYTKENIDKFGWNYIFYEDETLENLIILEIRKYIDGGEADLNQIEIATSLVQAISQQLSNAEGMDIPEEIIKAETPRAKAPQPNETPD